MNKKIEEGEDPRLIYTVRGTVPWLLQILIATLRTEYYSRILDIVEKLALDSVYYVRQQATVALSLFAANIRAKQNKDGTPFDFKDEDKKRVLNLAFRMLNENRDFPRVLEYVANVFDKLRLITEDQAKEVLTIFCYDKNGNINPEYLTSHVVPLVLFFAEFRKKYEPIFNNEWFQDFLKKFINDAKDYSLKSTLIWHTWRVIEDDISNYSIVKAYIPLFFNNMADREPIGQMEFLINAVLKVSPQEGTELYQKFLEYLNNEFQITNHDNKIWFTHSEEIIRMIDPSKIDRILVLLKELRQKGNYVGEENIIFSTIRES